MTDFLLTHRFSWGAMAFAFTLGYTLGIVTVLWLAYWFWCGPCTRKEP